MTTSEPVPARTIGRDGKSYPSRRKPKPVAPKPDVEPARTTEDCRQLGNSGRNPEGTFAKGNAVNLAGKPKGTRHRATLMAESLIDSSGELLVNKCVAMALGGDEAAMRLVMERLCPPRRERPVNITMPKINVAADLIAGCSSDRRRG
jgi:hypothetical protein